ncbi:MAG: IS5 family transposase [Myxococcota bacterium]
MRSKRSKVHPRHKRRYRVTNWASYNQALRRRGDLTVWFSPEIVRCWTPLPSGLRGRPRQYSDAVIELALGLRLLFALPWRQTQGFLTSLLDLMGLDCPVPDYSTLARRSRDLDVAVVRRPADEPLHLALDATGLAVFGQGEWAAAKWGGRGKRGWRKLHIAVDERGVIQAAVLTEPGASDPTVAPELLEQVDDVIAEVIADGAYDWRSVYRAIQRMGARSVIPPSRNAAVTGKPEHRDRDAHLRRIGEVGRRQWRKEAGQHRQARAENTFRRLKSEFGPRLRARHPKAQQAEILTACNLLNRMVELGFPSSTPIRA